MRPRARCPVLFALALLFVPLLATTAAAQTSATITGTIDDPNRSVLPGVTVTVRNVGTSLSRDGRHERGGPLRHRRPAAGRLRAARRAHQLQAARAARSAADDCPGPRRQHHPRGRRTERSSRRWPATRRSSTPPARELSYLVGSEAIEQLPLNGRNYTDLALLQPGVLAYPASRRRLGRRARARHERQRTGSALERLPARRHAAERLHERAGRQRGRDGARHGDGSRVPRRDERLQRRVRPQLGRADQRADQVGHQPLSTAALYEFHRNDALDARNYFDAGEQARLPRATSSAARSAARSRAIALFFFVGYEALVERLGKTISTVVPDDNARARHPAERRRSRVNPAVRALPRGVSRAPTAPSLGQGLASLHVPVRSARSTSTSCRAGSTTTSAPARSSSAATRSTTPTSSCRPTIRSSRATSSRATSSSRANTASIAVAEHAQHGARRLQPDAHRPERRGQHLAAAAGVRAGRATAWATSTSAASSASVRRARATCASCRTCSALQNDVVAHARPPPAQGRRARRALPGQHGQPDLQPRHLRVRQPERVPAQPADTASSA